MNMIFHLAKSDTLTILWKELVFIFLFTLGLVYLEQTFFPKAVVLEKLFSVYSIMGFVISLLLVFRTNTAYDRWWEARKKWGEMVNDTRNFSVKLSVFSLSQEDRSFFARHIGNFPVSCKEHLRKGVDFSMLNLTPEERDYLTQCQHVPAGIVALLNQRLQELKESGQLSEQDVIRLDVNLNALLNEIGACERIKNTPIPYSYSLFFKKFIFAYVVTLPFAFVVSFGYFASIISTFIYYVFVSIEVLAEEIEDPFGTDDNDLPTDELAEKIQVFTQNMLSNKSEK
ncbi:MAG TPA: bestrophin family ion channel [Fluviicola sp.]|nr:bestrophin family ion channel [Fluviicola sp.]